MHDPYTMRDIEGGTPIMFARRTVRHPISGPVWQSPYPFMAKVIGAVICVSVCLYWTSEYLQR